MTFARPWWLLAVFAVLVAVRAEAASVDPTGVWLLDNRKVAIRIESCAGTLCGRIVWLKKPFDSEGRPKRDRHNPDAMARQRPLCGIEVLSGLKPTGDGRWEDGTIYNPQNGETYTASLRAKSGDVLDVRGYIGFPLFGRTLVLTRVRSIAGPDGPPLLPLSPLAENGRGEGQVDGLVDVDGRFGERQLDGPGCRPDDMGQARYGGVGG